MIVDHRKFVINSIPSGGQNWHNCQISDRSDSIATLPYVISLVTLVKCDIDVTHPNRQSSSANKCVFVVASVCNVVTICAWHDGHITDDGWGPNTMGGPVT